MIQTWPTTSNGLAVDRVPLRSGPAHQNDPLDLLMSRLSLAETVTKALCLPPMQNPPGGSSTRQVDTGTSIEEKAVSRGIPTSSEFIEPGDRPLFEQVQESIRREGNGISMIRKTLPSNSYSISPGLGSILDAIRFGVVTCRSLDPEVFSSDVRCSHEKISLLIP